VAQIEANYKFPFHIYSYLDCPKEDETITSTLNLTFVYLKKIFDCLNFHPGAGVALKLCGFATPCFINPYSETFFRQFRYEKEAARMM
jgi:hypothetical protein